MARMVKMEKDGIVTEVAASAFRNVWAHRGAKLVDDATETDPLELGLGEDETLEDYKTKRDAARAERDKQVQALDENLAARQAAEAAAAQRPALASASASSNASSTGESSNRG